VRQFGVDLVFNLFDQAGFIAAADAGELNDVRGGDCLPVGALGADPAADLFR
jgi:hypothetical protein